MNLGKILKTLAIVNFAFAVIVCFGFFLSWINEGTFLVFTYIEAIIATAITLLFSIGGFIGNPKNAKSVFIGLGSMALLLIISWVLASDEIPAKFLGNTNIVVTNGDSKVVGASLYAIYILLFLGVVGMIGSEIYRVVIKR